MKPYRVQYCVVWVAVFWLDSPTFAIDPVTLFFAEQFASRVVDGAWDAVTGKPNIRLINERLEKLEASAVLWPEMRVQIERLATQLNKRVTKEEFEKLARSIGAELSSIRQRLDDLEQRVEVLEVDNADRKAGTHYAAEAEYYLNRGVQFAKDKNVVRALANINACLAIDPKSKKAIFCRARIYASQKLWFAVIVDMDTLLKQDSSDFDALQLRCQANLQTGEFDQCIRDGSVVLKQHSDVKEVRSTLAKAHFALADKPIASLPADDHIIEQVSKGESTYFERLAIHVVRECSAAIELDPDFVEAYDRRAQFYDSWPGMFKDAKGNNGEILALQDYATIVKLNDLYRENAITRQKGILLGMTDRASSIRDGKERKAALERIDQLRKKYLGGG